MTFARVNPAGWALFELLSSSQMNALDINMTRAVDGWAGGTYAPTGVLQISGDNTPNTGPVLKLTGHSDDSRPALEIALSNGSAKGLEIYNSSSNPLVQTMLRVEGAAITYSSGTIDPAAVINANDMTGSNGQPGMLVTGGSSNGSFGGDGLQAYGGAGTAVGSRGGYGIYAVAGNSDISSLGSGAQARAGAIIAGADALVGGNSTHRGGLGVQAFGGYVQTGTGRGGDAVYGYAGYGPSGNLFGFDSGAGIIGRGQFGVLGVHFSINPDNIPSEFDAYSKRVGVYALGSTGHALISQFSGSPSASANLFELVGVSGASNSILEVKSHLTSGTPGLTYGITSFSADTINSQFTNVFYGNGAPALQLNPIISAGVTPPPLTLARSYGVFGDEYVTEQGAMGFIGGGYITGLLDDALFIGSGTTREMYDRVVTSGDRAAAHAWARADYDGAGNLTLGANYGVDSVVVADFGGGNWFAKFTLDTITGQAVAAGMIAIGLENNFGAITTAYVENATTVWVAVREYSGAYRMLNGGYPYAMTLGFVMFSAIQYGSPADRPTYYRP
jgi:hypothetical protein